MTKLIFFVGLLIRYLYNVASQTLLDCFHPEKLFYHPVSCDSFLW